METPETVTDFWLNEIGPQGWYQSSEALDDEIRRRFEGLWQQARAGGLKDWKMSPDTMLAYLILVDQFPRNMFRDSALAFATDKLARATAKKAIEAKWDMRVPEPARQFFYLPLMHAECLADQDRCVRLMLTRMPETGTSNLRHAKAHREVIRRFGRFPYRNKALARTDTLPEAAFQHEGGYGAVLNAVSA